jgi:SpoIID/LytB domain protein
VGMSQYGARAMAAEGKSATSILQYYYNPAKVANSTTAASGDIRVQLLKAGTGSLTVAGGRMRVTDPTAKKTYTAVAGSTLTLGRSGTQLSYVLKTPAGFDVVARDKNKDGVRDVNPAPEANKTTGKLRITWEGTRAWPSKNGATISVPKANAESAAPGQYRHGALEVGLLGDQVNLVNSLRLNDEYLYGLAEVPSSWPNAVLQAQAIAGRTYAMRKINSLKASCDCNVTDEVQDQKFTGWKKENEQPGYGTKWKTAVNATVSRNSAGVPTSGKVVMYAGRLAETLYSSSTGGATRNSEDVWGGAALPYLRSRTDPWSLKASANNPYRSWTQSTSQREMAKVFGLPDVVSITFTRAKDLTISTATAKSASGTSKTLKGNTFRGSASGIGAHSAWISGIKPSVVAPKATAINARNFCTTTVKPGASIPTAASKARDGAVICLQPGTHKPNNLVLKPRQTLVGHTRSNTRLDGTIAVSTKKSGALHRIGTARIPTKAPTTLACTTGSQCNTAQVLFANGAQLTRVSSKSKVKSGSYWIDHKGRAIFTGKASSSKNKYAMASLTRAVTLGTWSRMGNVNVIGYANPSNTGAVWLRGAHSTLNASRVAVNHGIGVQSNGNSTGIVNSIIRLNGQAGISASGGKHSVVRGTEISNNGWAGFKPATFTGGIAASNKATVKVSASKILDNRGAGTRGVRTRNGATVSVGTSTVRGNK